MNEKLTKRGHRHAEAFCRMKYRCEGCGHWEWIWNSRDGVTPYIVNSRCCEDASATHVQWQEDVYDPSHQLVVGERFFRDGTAAEAVAVTERQLQRYAEQGHVVPDDVKAAMLQDAKEQREPTWCKGWPYLDEPEEPIVQRGEEQ